VSNTSGTTNRGHDAEHVRSVGTAFLLMRPLLVAPAGGLALLVTVLSGGPREQVLALSGLYAVVMGFFSFRDLAADAKSGRFRAERSLVARAVEETQGNQSEAARRLKITRTTLIDKMKRYGL